MKNYAVIDTATVTNVVVAESQEIAEAVVGLPVLETTGVPWIEWTLHGDEWRPPMPTENGPWTWDEPTLTWVEA